MKMNIDLGKKMSEAMPSAPSESKPYYPSFTFDTDEAYDFPDEGTMTVKFKKVRSETSKGEGDKTRHSCTIEVQNIKSVSGDESKDEEPAKNRQKETGDALDNLRDAAIKKKKAAADDEDGDEGY